MILYLFIGGVDRTDYLKVNSARFSGDLNGRWTLAAVLEEKARGYRPVNGAVIKISDGASPETIYFEGNISRIVERAYAKTSALQYDIEAQDYNHILSRRLVNAEYENQTLYDIVDHVNTNFLNGEGITLGSVTNPGPTITEKLTFRYESAASCFNRLSAITGYQCYIDFAKVMHFAEYVVAAPVAFTVTDSSDNWRNLDIERSNEDYRNRQYERTEIAVAATAGSFSSTNPTESPITAFAGQTSFPTSGVVTEMRRITVDGVDKTFYNVPVGEAIPGSGYDFYALIGGIGFFALDWGPAAGGEIVKCDYLGDWSMYSTGAGGVTSADPAAGVRVVMAEDTAAQATRVAIEGGSGIHEAIEEQRNISSAAALRAIAEGRIRQYGVNVEKIKLETDVGDALNPGDRVVVNVTKHSINATYLIERLERTWLRASPDYFNTLVYFTSAEPYGRPVGFIEKLVETARIGPGSGAGGSATAPGGGSTGVLVIRERPKGLVNGSNLIFDLTYEPDPPESLRLTINGVLADPLDGYSLSGARITYVSGCQPANTTDEHLAWYFHGGVAPTIGPGTLARLFDGNDLINWGASADFNISGDMSFGCWLKMSATSVVKGAIVAHGPTTSNAEAYNHLYWLLSVGTSNAWDLLYYHEYGASGTGESHTFDSNIANDVWRYVGFSRDATAKSIALYVGDGNNITLVETWVFTNSPTGGTHASNELVIGDTQGGTGGLGNVPFEGIIAEHMIWNRTLTQAEHVLAMQKQPPLSGLKLWCLLAGTSPEVDYSGNGHSGTVTGTTVVAGH